MRSFLHTNAQLRGLRATMREYEDTISLKDLGEDPQTQLALYALKDECIRYGMQRRCQRIGFDS
jgi:hypothetical protein